MLPNLKLGLDGRTGLNRFLTAWKSPDDPATCRSLRLNPNGSPQLFLYEGQIPRWRSGHCNGLRWTGVPILQVRINFNVSFVNNDDELTIMWGVRNRSIFSRLVADEPGSVQRFTWHEQIAKWDVFWSAPTDQCDNYGRCGAYGKCDPYDAYNFECTCLPGYQPKSISDWYLRDGSGGCIQKNLTGMCNNGEGFVKVENVKVPDPSTARVDNNLDLKACMEQCLRNCSCTAYASSVVTSKSGCFSWYGNLLDTRVFAEGGQDLYVRVDAFELAQYDKKSRGFLSKKGMLAGLVLPIADGVFFVIMFSFWLIKRKKTVWKTTYLKRISRHVIIFLFPFGLFNTLLLNFTVHHGPQILQTSASSSRLTFSSKARALPAPSSEPSTPASIGSQELQKKYDSEYFPSGLL
ncbi:hypothetical protein POTOM_014960 [Populus tomentosa]|uniref:non-specific serine/threonine protein kinase n=1 Tax=Populus tomentosa TaxID=118781 RepID=A0A8X8A298_POPTO|nr:hypothetical protein POTOM_014960 [Populus tomentosa]